MNEQYASISVYDDTEIEENEEEAMEEISIEQLEELLAKKKAAKGESILQQISELEKQYEETTGVSISSFKRKPREDRMCAQTVSIERAIDAIRSYNEGTYRKRPNLELDAEGYSKFQDGLGKTVDKIKEQVRWIAQDYGAVGNKLAGQALPSQIAGAIFDVRADYNAQLLSSPILIEELPTSAQVEWLYQPFQQEFVSPKKGSVSRHWMVWATKFWHFLKPQSFPIMDSYAKQFYFGKKVSGKDPVYIYILFLKRVQETIQSHKGLLPQLRQIDEGHAKSDIKLWDKIAFKLGDTDKGQKQRRKNKDFSPNAPKS